MKRIISSQNGIAVFVVGVLMPFAALAASPPTITSWPDGKYVNKLTQTIVGGCVSGNSIQIYGDFVAGSKSLVCSRGSYSYRFNLISGDGPKRINVTATDAAGTSDPNSRILNLDMSIPQPPTFSSPSAGSTVNSRDVIVRGGCESGVKVVVGGNIVSPGTAVDCVSESYSLAVRLTDGNGAKAISAFQRDLALNRSVAAKLNLTLNVYSIPSISAPTIESPAANAQVRTVAQIVSGSCQSGATVNINGDVEGAPHAVSCSNGSYSHSLNLISGDGSKSIRVSQSASDVTSSEASRSLTLDTMAPSAPTVTSPVSGATVSSTAITVVGACESSAVVSLSGAIESAPRVVTCANSAYSIAASLVAGAGAKVLSVVQSDRAGNISAARSLNLTLSGGTTNPNPGNFLTIFDCNSSNFIGTSNGSSAPCAVDTTGWNNPPNGFEIPGSFAAEASIENGVVYLSRGDGGHLGTNMVYQRQVNARAFEATFTFVPSGKNIALVLQNSSYNSWGFYGKNFNSGAGCEAGFFQAFTGGDPAVDKIFALAIMQDMPLLSVNDNPANDYFTYSSAMIYKTGESPCSSMITPVWANETPFSIPTKISTYPVALNSVLLET